MKKIFKYGLGLLLPIALVAQVIWWIYNLFANLTKSILPVTMSYEWWYPCVVLVGIIVAIFLIGLLFKIITPLKWLKDKFDKYIINHIPVVNKIYGFGREVSDSFITDIKEDGDLQVVEVAFGGFKLLGVLTDERNSLGFILSAPSPLTGVVMKLPNYKKLDITFLDAVQINTSLGRINGSKWK